VVEVGKKYFSKTVSTTFDEPRLKLIFDDAARYLREEGSTENYDVIICDSSDPVGPAETLFEPAFFNSMYKALAPGGVVCTQGECLWLHLDLISNVLGNVRSMFPTAKYAYTTIPTYPSGQIGFIVGAKASDFDLTTAKRTVPEEWKLKYYTDEIHKVAFVLPGMTLICQCIL
jgi:spermidine synthase